MRMKKWGLVALVLTLVLGLGVLSIARADETTAIYKLGDKADDFTVTMSDGQEINLYGLLAEKKVVMLNFWASWCNPCQREFPYLQEAYDQLSDDVGMIALSIYEKDTDEVIEDFKTQLGLTTLPLGQDIGLAAQYGVNAYPTSVIIDRNGVICLIHSSIIPSTRTLTNMLSMFTGDDYSAPVLLDELPMVPVTETPGAAELSAALNAPGGELEFVSLESDDGVWPFIPSEDGSCAVASNTEMQGSTANVLLDVTVKAGDVLVYDCRMNGMDYDDRLVAFVDSTAMTMQSGTQDWTTSAFRFETDGAHTVTFIYARGRQAGYTAACELKNVRLLTGDEVAAYEMPVSTAPKSLPGSELSLEIPEDAKAVLVVDAEGVAAGDRPILYVTNTDTAELKLRIGADIDENFAGLTITRDLINQETVMLNSLEHDDEGYLYTVDLTKGSTGATVTLKSNVLDSAASIENVILCASEEYAKQYMFSIMSFMAAMSTREQLEQSDYFALSYEGGPAFYTSDELYGALIASLDAAEAAKADTAEDASAPATLSYTITFTDPDGKPVQNVMAQICDDATCNVLPSDENGVVLFEGENHAYELHVLTVPAGYQAPAETFELPEEGGAFDVTIETVAP